jgi:hypothetical protein
MTETVHIFDEFPWTEKEITQEQQWQKRFRLEPLVFNILQKKYGKQLESFYLMNPPVRDSKKCILIVERRIHENLEFVLHNCRYFARDWSLCFVCSDINMDFCKEIAGPHRENIHFLPIFQGSPSREEGRNEYSNLLKSADFWRDLPWDMVSVVQTDSYFLKQIPDDILDYDFIAATASWDYDSMVGGLSFRRPSAMVQICENFKEDIFSEDVYFSEGAKKLGLRLPGIPERFCYITESCFFGHPVGTHQWWTYFFKNAERAELIFQTLLRLDV